MSEAIIGGVFGLVGTIVGIVGTYFVNNKTKENERNRHKMKTYLEQLIAFYNLEQLYMSAVAKLRAQIPAEQGSKTELGIQREFRSKNEENSENVCITMTSKRAKALLAAME